MEARIAELIALAVVLLCMAEGASRGLVMKVYSLVRIILLLVVTIILTPLILPLFPTGYQGREGLSFFAALVITAIALHILADILKIVDHIPVVSTVNKLGGAVLGAVIGVLLVWVILLLIGAMQDVSWCQRASGAVRQSRLLMQLQQFNPLPKILENFGFSIL